MRRVTGGSPFRQAAPSIDSRSNASDEDQCPFSKPEAGVERHFPANPAALLKRLRPPRRGSAGQQPQEEETHADQKQGGRNQVIDALAPARISVNGVRPQTEVGLPHCPAFRKVGYIAS